MSFRLGTTTRRILAITILALSLAIASPASAQYMGGTLPNVGSLDSASTVAGSVSAAGGVLASSGQRAAFGTEASSGFQARASQGLAFTGGDVIGLGLFALLLMVVGAGFVTASRRREPRRAPDSV